MSDCERGPTEDRTIQVGTASLPLDSRQRREGNANVHQVALGRHDVYVLVSLRRFVAHVAGMAQDVFAAFGLGDTDKGITTIDADGVALAAIQGVCQIVQDKEAGIAALEKNNRELQMRLLNVEALVHALSDRLPSDCWSE